MDGTLEEPSTADKVHCQQVWLVWHRYGCWPPRADGFFVASFVFEELLHEGTCQPDLEAMDGFFSGAITFTYLENIRLLGGNAVHRVIGVKIGANALAGGHLLIIRKELVQILVK